MAKFIGDLTTVTTPLLTDTVESEQSSASFKHTLEQVQTFIGVLDGSSNVHTAYAMRQLRSAYVGPLCEIERASDNVKVDFYPDAMGHFPRTAAGIFLAGSAGTIRTWYDQSGSSRDVLNATTAQQPDYDATGQNGRPVVSFAAGADEHLRRTISGDALIDQTVHTITAVCKADLTTGYMMSEAKAADTTNYYIQNINSSGHWNWLTNSPGSGVEQQTLDLNLSDNTWSVIAIQKNNGASATYVDGAVVDTDTYTQRSDIVPTHAAIAAWAKTVPDNEWGGGLGELITLSEVDNSALVAIQNNQQAYWSI